MYLPRHFEMPEDDAIAFVREVGVGHLITTGEGGIEASLVPFLVDERDGVLTVRAHLAAGNPQRQAVRDRAAAMLLVAGPDAYVSPSLYAGKREHGKVVPTWNYVAVHLHGTLQPVESRDELLAIVSGLTDLHESRRAEPWAVSDAPADFVDTQLKAIVGLTLVVERVDAKAKLSQNRTEADRAGVRAAFLAGGTQEQALGRRMPEPT